MQNNFLDETLPRESGREPWYILVAAIEQLSAARSLDDVVEIVRVSARGIADADGVTFVLRDGEFCHYVAENAISPLWAGQRFPLCHCISGWCMLNGQVAAIPDIYADPRIPHDAYKPTFVKSLVMTPVGAGPALAAIGAYWAKRREAGAETICLLGTLARSAAVALANIQLYSSQRLLINELNHRVKNTLATVQSLAHQTRKSANDVGSFIQNFEGRLMALSRAQNLLTESGWTGTDLELVIREQISDHGEAGGGIAVAGASVFLEPGCAQQVGLMVHELAANARKFGALSVPQGRVQVTWTVTPGCGGHILALRWAESGGPAVTPPKHSGFGMRLIKESLAPIGGAAKLDFAESGVSAELRLPIAAAAPPEEIALRA